MTTRHFPDSRPQDRRLRVALVITELNVGGAERNLTQLAIGLDRARFEPLVISIAPPPAGEQQVLVQRLEAAGVPVRFLDAASKWQLPIAVRRLRKTLNTFAPDVVQSFLFHADVLTRLASRGKSWRSYLGLRVADPSRRRQRLERWAAKRATAVVCVSDAVGDYARQTIGLPGEKVVAIPNAVDVDPHRAARPIDLTMLGVAPARRAILCVARLHPQKGIDWLLGAMPTVFDNLPDHDLIIVGTGADEARLRQQAGALKIADRVHFVGWRPDVPQLMAVAEMLVLPSRWEGMPNVVLEAMAAGLPVVASDTQGIQELLGPDSESQTISFGESDALVERITAMGRDAQRAGSIGAANQARAAAHFALPRMIASYEALYASAGSHGKQASRR